MRTKAELQATMRETRGKGGARRMRAAGRVPAVVYGKGTETLSLSVDTREVEHLFATISVENTIVDLTVEGEKKPIQTLVREVQVHPARPDLLHIDFYRIRKGVKLEVDIPVRLNGVPEGVKTSGGILQQVIHELSVLVLPSKIPESIEVDVTAMEVGDSLHVGDIETDEDFEVLIDPERTVATVVLPKIIEEEPEVEDEDLELLEGEEGEAPEGAEPAEGSGETGDDES